MNPDPFSRGGLGQASGRRRGGIRWWVILAFGAYALYYWFGNQQEVPFTGEKQVIDTSLEEEAQLGLQAYRQVLGDAQAQGKLVPEDAEISRQVQEIAARLVNVAPDVEKILAEERGITARTQWDAFQWHVSVIDDPQANAFCLPGGKMAVYTGIVPVAQNADALAVVMGHEIAHALLRHGAARMAQQKLVQIGQMAGGIAVGDMDPRQQQMVLGALGAGAQYGFVLPYGREHETQADEVGLMLAAAACYDPAEAPKLWERMSANSGGGGQPEFTSTHPNPETRIQRLSELVPKAQTLRAKFCGGTR